MTNISIRNAMIGIFAVICMAFAGFSFFAITQLTLLHGSTDELVSRRLPAEDSALRLTVDIANLKVGVRDHALASTPEDMTSIETSVGKLLDRLVNRLKDYDEHFADSEQEHKVIASALEKTGNFKSALPTYFEVSRKNDNEETAKFIHDKMLPLTAQILQKAELLVEMNKKDSDQAGENALNTYSFSRKLMIALSAAVGLFAMACATYAVLSIARPLLRLAGAMKQVAAGVTDLTIPYTKRRSELGAMATALDGFREAAIAKIALEEQSAAAREQAKNNRIAAQQKAEQDAADRLRAATTGLAEGLNRLAHGDLSFQITEPFSEEFEPLRNDFNAAVAQLGQTLGTITASVLEIEGKSREIASGAHDLSRRTEHQAASLEETSASVEQISANVRSATALTEEARGVAEQANTSAGLTAGVVANAEEAMRKIEESSREISNIIGVIDEIAFQTNLLALNAGVEAARAGDQGKGFAVVAQEVRELAQRSAKAAKEIKDLIQKSGADVNGGVQLVREAGQALGTIVGYIGTIHHHMDAISGSARDQATGLNEITSAVSKMDQSTQQNAAMVEESTAASAVLASEADRLKALVAGFSLPEQVVQHHSLSASEGPAATASNPVSGAALASARRSGGQAQDASGRQAQNLGRLAATMRQPRSNTATAVAQPAEWTEF